MGVIGLLTSTTGVVSALTNFGLGTSAVKNVAAAAATGNQRILSKTVSVLRKLILLTGCVGMILTAVFSPWLSQLTFGNKDYTLAFIWLSVILLFQQLSSGQLIVLQGLRKLKFLAKANIIGSVIGLILSVPIYYFWRIEGVVPVIIISAFTAMLLSWHFTRKIGIEPINVTKNEILTESKEMLKMGFMINLSGLVAVAVSYIVRIYISKIGGVDDVGLYTAGFAIIGTYVGMIFTAMNTDYYPKLSMVAHDYTQCRTYVNQQAEIAVLIIAPILAIFLVFIKWIVILLYSTKFLAINEMIHWAALGMYFKAASWSVSILILAKGESKVYFWNELLANIYILIFNIAGYKLAGLEGLGISFMLSYLVYLFQVYYVTKIKYCFSFDKAFYRVGGFQVLLGLLCFVTISLFNSPLSLIIGCVFIVVSIFHSLVALDKRIAIVSMIKGKIARLIGHCC